MVGLATTSLLVQPPVSLSIMGMINHMAIVNLTSTIIRRIMILQKTTEQASSPLMIHISTRPLTIDDRAICESNLIKIDAMDYQYDISAN